MERYEKAKAKAVSLQQKKEERLAKRDLIGGFMSEFAHRKELLTEFDEKLWIALVEHVRYFRMGDWCLRFGTGRRLKYRIINQALCIIAECRFCLSCRIFRKSIDLEFTSGVIMIPIKYG